MVREIFRCDILAVHVSLDIYVAVSYDLDTMSDII